MDRTATVAKPGISARQLFSVRRGEFWQARCDRCQWTSGVLPTQSEGAALHIGNLHTALCKRQ